MQCRLITDKLEFLTLQAEWSALLAGSQENTIFLTWEWMTSWLEARSVPTQLFIIIVRNEVGELLGCAPLYRSDMRLVNMFRYKTLRVIGDHSSGSDYPGFIAQTIDAITIKQKLFETLSLLHSEWDILWLPNCSGWLNSDQSFLDAAKSQKNLRVRTAGRTFALLRLPDTLELYWSNLSKNRRSNLRKITNRFKDNAAITITECKSLDQLQQELSILFDLHRQRWQTEHQQGAFVKRPAMVKFYRLFAPAALTNHWLKLIALRENGVIKAIQIGYLYNATYYVIQEGYDPEYTAGVGNYLRYKIIEECIESKIETYDFLQGFTEHKQRWNAELAYGNDILVWNGHFKNLMFKFKKIWPRSRLLMLDEP